uniref:Uncharacterized protein n=1 Tax=Panagrolaimus davidi TaxID=227884 RepID=A0A914QHU8_9BILA
MKDSFETAAGNQMNHGKITWRDCTSKKQYWPFRSSIIHYMAKNPSTAKCYLKMAQSCKYFFEANPFIIVSNLAYDLDDKSFALLCQNKWDECDKKERKCCTKINLNNLLHKLWITETVDIDDQAYIPFIRTKIYRCEVTVLGIFNIKTVFDDFKRMTLFAKYVIIWDASIKYNDEKVVPLDKIIESLPNLKYLELGFVNDSSMINTSTNILKLQNLKNLESVFFYYIPESLNIRDLSAFIKKYKEVEIIIYFNENISNDYKNQLDALIDEIIESEVLGHFIAYRGQNEKKLKIMESRLKSDFKEDINDA